MSDMTDASKWGQSHRVQIEITRVPKSPTRMRVRWLSGIDGLFVHFRGHSIPCQDDRCPRALHELPREWRGYAPAEVLDLRERCWRPTVVEVTTRLWFCMEGVTLRGTIWDVLRRPGRRDKEECWGEQIAEVDPQTLRTDIDHVTAVRRMYQNRPLVWGKLPEIGAPQQVATSVWVEAPPLKLIAEVPDDKISGKPDKPLSGEEMRRLIAEARAQQGFPPKKDGAK